MREPCSLEAEEDGAPIVRRLCRAGEAPPPRTRAARSVFDLAQALERAPLKLWPKPTYPAPRPVPRFSRVVRDCSGVRHTRINHTDTAEWQEKEAARRARQVVPRPPKQTFTLRSE